MPRAEAATELRTQLRTELRGRIGYSVRDAAIASGLSMRTLYLLIESGALESSKVGGRRLIIADSLEKIVREGHKPIASHAGGNHARRSLRREKSNAEPKG